MLKITRYNCNFEEVESVIKTEDIIGLTERKRAPKCLYDEEGELVETKEQESNYVIFFENHQEMIITKETYEKLIKKLNVETL